jgi:hypothetical protein
MSQEHWHDDRPRDLQSWLAANTATIGATTGLIGVAVGATIISTAPILGTIAAVSGTAVAAGSLYHKLTHRSSD